MTEQDKRYVHVLKFLNDVLEGDKAKVQQIANMAVLSIEKDVEGIYSAYESKDVTKAHDHLHKMKSNLANLDFRDLSARTPDHKSDDFWHILPNFLREVNSSLQKVKSVL